MKDVPIPMCHDQFFSFVILYFGCMLEALPATTEKTNLQEAWLKIQCKKGNTILDELEVQLPHNSHIIRLEAILTEDVPSH